MQEKDDLDDDELRDMGIKLLKLVRGREFILVIQHPNRTVAISSLNSYRDMKALMEETLMEFTHATETAH